MTTDGGAVFTPHIGAAYEHEFDGQARRPYTVLRSTAPI